MKDFKGLYEEHEVHGPTAKGLMIPSEALYQGRMAMAMGIVAAWKPASLLDIGCGYGDLSTVLESYTRYCGIDYTHWIAKEAEKRVKTGKVYHMSFREFSSWVPMQFEMVACLGVLATMDLADAVEMANGIDRVAARMILLSYLVKGVYEGKMESYGHDQVDGFFHRWFPTTKRLFVPGDETSCTVLYRLDR